MVQVAADPQRMKENAAPKFDTLERFMWPGGDEAKPAVNKNHIRMYGHNLCPFVERSRWTFAAKDVQFQEVFVDLNSKAGWHTEFNGGMIPVLEVPSGQLIPESQVIADYALQVAGSEQGIKLIPDDPVQAALMRAKMAEFDSKILSFSFGIYFAKYSAGEAMDKYVANAVPWNEALCPEVGSDKWLFGTDEITQLDIHIGAQWDFVYCQSRTPAFADGFGPANLPVVSPKWCAYMERLRSHPKLAPVAISQEAADKHATRVRSWPAEERCQLSLDVLQGLFPNCP